ncbi:hypothetical protein DPV78_002212 [Talaromyces pinophilus]|nr:hypothetical protein DPV78_002212 [Talaromyces pinophilus]
MIEQFLDFCRLYPVGRLVRKWNKIFYFPNTKAATWASDYMDEVHIGIVLLRREKYLQEQRKEILQQQQQKQRLEGVKLELKFQKACGLIDEFKRIQQDILQTQKLCHVHEERMRVLWSILKSDSFSRDVLMTQNPQWRLIMGKQPYAWVQARNQCAYNGGCCGRECQCCEKPLKVVTAHEMSFIGPRKKKSGIYGHCTAECGCCIRYKVSTSQIRGFKRR